MNEAKIRLSQKEMELVDNIDFILTKNEILRKTALLLGNLQEQQQAYLNTIPGQLLPEKKMIPPKISRGEKYNGLPYMILDYPRVFEKENIFAIRTLFWWGNFFSTTLHLSGNYKELFKEKIMYAFDVLKKEGYYSCTNDDEWHHHFEEDNYVILTTKNVFEESIHQKPFLKLSKKIPLHQWESADGILFNNFKWLIEILTGQLPRR